jgi:excisionase family DNA binding protein
VPETRNLGTAKQAAAIAGVSPPTVRTWLQKRLIGGVRVGRNFRYDLDDVAAMVVTYPRADVDERIAELVQNAPEFSAEQVNKIRLVLYATPDRSGGHSAT